MAKNRTSKPNVLAGLTNLQNNNEPNTVSEPVDKPAPIPEPIPKPVVEEPQPVVQNFENRKVPHKPSKVNDTNKFTVYLDDEQYLFLKKNCWEYNSMNGFIKYLIDEERKRRGE